MQKPTWPDRERALFLGRKARAYGVHVLTASGIIFAFLAMAELFNPTPDPRWVFIWLLAAVIIDATDGPLARLWNVKARAPRFGGRTIDEIVDYLTFTFIPLLMVWRMEWVSDPAAVWVVLAMGASLFGFSNADAKQAAKGFFMGFPSYWNVVAFYAGILATEYAMGADVVVVLIVVLAVLTIVPVRFVYPNHAPKPWRAILVGAGILWTALLLAMLPSYPELPGWGDAWVLWVSLFYPVLYVGLSAVLDVKDRRKEAPMQGGATAE